MNVEAMTTNRATEQGAMNRRWLSTEPWGAPNLGEHFESEVQPKVRWCHMGKQNGVMVTMASVRTMAGVQGEEERW